MSEWIPFYFPKCPSCQKNRGNNFHKNCLSKGQLLVEIYQRQVRCDYCYEEWYIMNSKFHCSCGYTFNASEVENALSTTQLLRNRLIHKINEMDSFEKSINMKSQNSFSQWIGSISYEIGRLLGTTASKAKQLIQIFFEKWLF